MAGQGSGTSFDELAEAMPKIASALKDLPESVHGKAFDALVASFTGNEIPSGSDSESRAGTRSRRKKAPARRRKATGDGEKPSRRRVAAPVTLIKDLDLAPKGKESFADFAAAKKPKTQHDRSVVSAYWLVEVAGVSPISVGHIFTCYRKAGWKVPANMTNGLAVTANRKGYFDTADGNDIKLKPHGINRVEHELPEKAKSTA